MQLDGTHVKARGKGRMEHHKVERPTICIGSGANLHPKALCTLVARKDTATGTDANTSTDPKPLPHPSVDVKSEEYARMEHARVCEGALASMPKWKCRCISCLLLRWKSFYNSPRSVISLKQRRIE